mmetsp:Transcript_16918/g.36899  ORF Transcript_16918/g.36899 Transcript_16918/m.36899 type:complete len:244 (+) Transcript_16918:118-849(+)|eukprot:CAMPEP_0168754020 /NCGR_PEP_ID=MMETSP0724-20121128/19276_1 /TAXON_ID=265536 /ORGANISM="Amphiprora sp., Strain CCMP467" /LENGTH=243 /DNA_ID=CAMNT_0008802467 /DNA_START=95 /DNA_END=826 /DNA_ORIENTATION=-
MYDTSSAVPTVVRSSGPLHKQEESNTMHLNNASGHLSNSSSSFTKSSCMKKQRSSSKRSTVNEKSVQFASNAQGEVQCQYHPVHKDIKPRDHAKIWLSKKELEKTSSEVSKLVKHLKRDKNYCWAVSLQYRFNTKAGVSERDELKARHILRQYSAECRGLERKVDSTTSQAILSRHKKNVCSVSRSTKGQQSATFVRTQSKATSGMGRDLAAALGKLDALDVQDQMSSSGPSSHSELVMDSLL